MDTPKLLPPRWWWLVLFALILCAGLLRLTGYNFSLPYIDHPDEPNFNIAAQMIIDMGTSKSMHYQGYPPGIVTVNYLFLRFFHDPTTPPGTIIWMIRLLAIATSLALMLVIGLLGALLATPLAGLLAAALWGFNPVAVEFSRYATADIFVAVFTVLAVYLVLAGVRYRREGWVTAGILANLMGVDGDPVQVSGGVPAAADRGDPAVAADRPQHPAPDGLARIRHHGRLFWRSSSG
ncbi:MAG: glycosyltransferase family 39 protein [Anaerolineae bacterium]